MKEMLINWRESREGGLKSERGRRKHEAESTGFVQPEGKIKGESNGCLLLPNEIVIEMMKPEVH